MSRSFANAKRLLMNNSTGAKANVNAKAKRVHRQLVDDFRLSIPPPPPPSLRTYSSSSKSSSISSGFLGWYLRMIDSRPLLTKSITSSLIYAAADLTAQVISLSSSPFVLPQVFLIHILFVCLFMYQGITLQPSASIDLIRTLRMSSYGLLILGPSQHYWFNFVSRLLPTREVVTTLKKIVMGQAIYGPCINTVFFSYNAALQGNLTPFKLKSSFCCTVRLKHFLLL